MCPSKDLFTNPATLSCPYEYFDEVRQETAAYYSESLQAYVVSRYDDAKQVFLNPRVFSSTPQGGVNFMAHFSPEYRQIYAKAEVPPPIPALVVTDGDTHRRYRKHVDEAFGANSVNRMEGKVVALVDELIDEFIDIGAVDLYRKFCLRLPLYVICDMLGLPRQDIVLLQAAADASIRLAGGAGETEEGRLALHRTIARFHEYLAGHISRVRAQPDETLLSSIIHKIPPDGLPMDDAELMSLVSTFNAGGNETTSNGLGNMFWLAFQKPERMAELRADRSIIPKFAEEALRIESPVSAMPRWVMQDTKVGGVPIPKGSVILISISAGNRDATQFDCPAEIDTQRKGLRNHLAFGMGVHYCLGSILARLELTVSMNRVLDRMHDIQLDTAQFPAHQSKIIVRALTTLPIRFHRRSAPH